MSEKQFLEIADTGDILLFQTGTKTGTFIRKITGGSFDHVAMILRFESEENEVFFVEASGNYGVALNKWSSVRKHVGKNKFYERLVYRRVNFERDDELVDCLEVFLKEAVGRAYGLNIKKLLKRKTVGFNPMEVGEDGKVREMINENRTFFCSELVAKAFKVFGVLQNDQTSSSSFLPKHFSSKHDKALKLTPNSSIDAELQIIVESYFDKKIKEIND